MQDGFWWYLFGRHFMCSCGHDHSYCNCTACPSGSYLAPYDVIVVHAQEKLGMSSHSFKPHSIHAVEDGGFSMMSSWYSRLYHNNNNSYGILQLQDGLYVVWFYYFQELTCIPTIVCSLLYIIFLVVLQNLQYTATCNTIGISIASISKINRFTNKQFHPPPNNRISAVT
jgi:hypothetical protein